MWSEKVHVLRIRISFGQMWWHIAMSFLRGCGAKVVEKMTWMLKLKYWQISSNVLNTFVVPIKLLQIIYCSLWSKRRKEESKCYAVSRGSTNDTTPEKKEKGDEVCLIAKISSSRIQTCK
mmetsp:Transcript_27918/g.43349  ORF Transcript_27918/g.43349 Transcript_27918/m.43349 type:complete len:120 (+) Transcript_27918:2070-2429(+)